MKRKTIRPVHSISGYLAPRLFYYGLFTPLSFLIDRYNKAKIYFSQKNKDEKVFIYI